MITQVINSLLIRSCLYHYAKLRSDSKIDLLDSAESITKKIRKAECFPKIVEDNGVLSLVEHILLPAAVLKGHGEFRVERKDAEPLVFTDIKQMHDAYAADIVCLPIFLITQARI